MIASGDRDEEKIALMGDKVLGHKWNPTEDKFLFRISVNLAKKGSQQATQVFTIEDIPKLIHMHLTKRMLLGLVNSQYDPMGLICPLLIILKINLRDLFGPEVELGWDDPIPFEQHERWVQIISMLLHIDDIVLDRAV